MLVYKDYIVLFHEKDYDDYSIIWERDDSVRLSTLGVVYKATNYPQCYRYEDSMDAHFCGSYIPCDMQNIYNLILKDKNKLEKLEKSIEKLL